MHSLTPPARPLEAGSRPSPPLLLLPSGAPASGRFFDRRRSRTLEDLSKTPPYSAFSARKQVGHWKEKSNAWLHDVWSGRKRAGTDITPAPTGRAFLTVEGEDGGAASPFSRVKSSNDVTAAHAVKNDAGTTKTSQHHAAASASQKTARPHAHTIARSNNVLAYFT